jgi:hypothetical protein
MHRLVVEKIEKDPHLFEQVKATLARWRDSVSGHSQPYLTEWELVAGRSMKDCLALAVEDSQRATALRKSSPFAGILSDAERHAFLDSWT